MANDVVVIVLSFVPFDNRIVESYNSGGSCWVDRTVLLLQSGQTALMLASNAGHMAIVRALLEAGADPSIFDMGMITARGMAKTGEVKALIESFGTGRVVRNKRTFWGLGNGAVRARPAPAQIDSSARIAALAQTAISAHTAISAQIAAPAQIATPCQAATSAQTAALVQMAATAQFTVPAPEPSKPVAYPPRLRCWRVSATPSSLSSRTCLRCHPAEGRAASAAGGSEDGAKLPGCSRAGGQVGCTAEQPLAAAAI
jgi:hypothetical protein